MTVQVRIPTVLRSYTSGAAEISVEGATLLDVLDAMESDHPGIRDRITEGGEIRRFMNVYVGDEDIRFVDGISTPTPDGVVVSVIPAVAGG